MQDRRVSPRKTLTAEVEYEVAGVRARARISNIGTMGVFIEGESQLTVGARLKLRLTLPGGQMVEASGVVAHRQTGAGVGVAFVSVGAETTRRIRQFLETDTS